MIICNSVQNQARQAGDRRGRNACVYNDDEIHSDAEDPPDQGISFEDFLFWGGFMGMIIDEEREERRLKKKKEQDFEPEDFLGLDSKNKDN